jgi:hypothetical protein
MSNEQPTEQVKDDAPQEESEIKGRDPNTEGPDHPQLKGTGAPGSHSAFFGLTPDGKKDENTKAGSTPPVKSSEGEEGGETASGGGTFTKDDGGSRGVTGHGVADQVGDVILVANDADFVDARPQGR